MRRKVSTRDRGKDRRFVILKSMKIIAFLVGCVAGVAGAAPMYTFVDLQPSGYLESFAVAAAGGHQVGHITGAPIGGRFHAAFWTGSAESFVDLHPGAGFVNTFAEATSDSIQVGYGYGPTTGDNTHALLWSGSAASVVDLHPNGYSISEALATNGTQQGGYAELVGTPGFPRAMLW